MHVFAWSIWKSMETARVWKTLSPGDWMRELVFWEEPWGLILVNLLNNFIKITFHDGFFPMFTAWWARGHYCWVAGCFTMINMAFHSKLKKCDYILSLNYILFIFFCMETLFWILKVIQKPHFSSCNLSVV